MISTESQLIKSCLRISKKEHWYNIRISSPTLIGYPDYLFFKSNICMGVEFKNPKIKTPPNNHQVALAQSIDNFKIFFINSKVSFIRLLEFYESNVINNYKCKSLNHIGLFQFWEYK